MIFRILLVLLLFYPAYLFSQDTNFINSHPFPTPVRNVFNVDTVVYVKTGDGLYKYTVKGWEKERARFEKTFVFFDKGFYDANYIPDNLRFDAGSMAYLIPQRGISNATKAQVNDRLYVSAGGKLFEYSVNNLYKHFYKDNSIRDIYIEPGLKVVSGYSGIYINDTLWPHEPDYSSGSFTRIRGKYYISSDQLFQYSREGGFHKIPSGANVFSGHSRKLVEWHNQVYSLNTKSVNVVDSNFELRPIHQGFEYYDLEAIDSALLFSTFSGEVFMYTGTEVKLLYKLKTRVREIYAFKNLVYLSSDQGVFTITNLDPKTVKILAALPFSLNVMVDLLNNTWITTENGLYVIPDKSDEVIPFIPNVEFNRGALFYADDNLYAGSITGLYVFNIYDVVRGFIPQYLNKRGLDESDQMRKKLLFGLVIIILLAGAVYFIREWRKSRMHIEIPHKAETGLTLEKIGQDIKTHEIMTVEGLAEFYKTNTVQLNRQFKIFNTTPGKFLKQVKLDYARELLAMGASMEEVVSKVGYSAGYLKKEI